MFEQALAYIGCFSVVYSCALAQGDATVTYLSHDHNVRQV